MMRLNNKRKLSPEELDEILKLHKKWLRDEKGGKRADLSYTQFTKIDLSGMDLRGVDLSKSSMHRVILRGADLSRSCLEMANLEGVDLRDANLQDAYLGRAYLTGADLRGANLKYADLEGAQMHKAKLEGADLVKTDLHGTYLSHTCIYTFTLGKHEVHAWFSPSNDFIIKIGCEEMTYNQWMREYKIMGKDDGYSEEEIKMYLKFINAIKKFRSK